MLSFLVLLLLATCLVSAQVDIGQPVCRVGEPETRALAEPYLCTAQLSPGASEGFFVTPTRIGVLSTRSPSTILRQATFESLGLVGVPQSACAAGGGRFFVWLRITTAPNIFQAFGFDAASLEIRFTSRRTSTFLWQAESLLAAAYHPQRNSLLTTTGRVASVIFEGAAVLLETSLVTNRTSRPLVTIQNAFFGRLRLDATNSTAPSVVVLPEGSVVVSVANYGAQFSEQFGIYFTPPATLVYTASSPNLVLERTEIMSEASGSSRTNLFGEVPQQTCGYPSVTATGGGGVSTTFATDFQIEPGVFRYVSVEVYRGISAGKLRGSGYFLFDLTENTGFGGACQWDEPATSLFRTYYPVNSTRAESLRFSLLDTSDLSNPGSSQFDFYTLSNNASIRARANAGFSPPRIIPAVRASRFTATSPKSSLVSAERPFASRGTRSAAATRRRYATALRKSRVLNGETVLNATTAPWQCRLSGPDLLRCTCNILDATHVLTAAHCVPRGSITLDTRFVEPYGVTLGGTDAFQVGPDQQFLTGTRSETHPSWRDNEEAPLQQDSAIVTLDTPIVLNSEADCRVWRNGTACPIALATDLSTAQPGQRTTLYGWGFVDDDGNVFERFLQKMNATVTQFTIEGPFPKLNMLGDTTPAGDQAVCSGDSGAGYVVDENLLVATASFIRGPCSANVAYAAAIAPATPWIASRENFTYATSYPGFEDQVPTRPEGRLLAHFDAASRLDTISLTLAEPALSSFFYAYTGAERCEPPSACNCSAWREARAKRLASEL